MTKACASASGLSHDQSGSTHIPLVEIQLPVGAEKSRSHVAHVYRRGSQTSQSPYERQHGGHIVKVVVGVHILIYGKSGGHYGVGDILIGRYMELLSVEVSTSTLYR